MTLAAAAPDRANSMIRDLADAGTLTRADLDGMLGARLTDHDRAALTAPDTSPPSSWSTILASTGVVGPATVVAVLHHEGVDGETVAGLIPAIGLPVPDAIRELHGRWGMDRLDAGAHLSATPDELRAAGCTTVEMLQAAPREVLRRLDTRPHTWELAGHALLEAGMSPAETIRQLALHAPTPETFAAGVFEIEPDPHRGVRRRRPGGQRAGPRQPVGAVRHVTGRDGVGPEHRLCADTDAGAHRSRTMRRRARRHRRRLRGGAVGGCGDGSRSPLSPVVISLDTPAIDGDFDEFAQLRDALGDPVAASDVDDHDRRRADRGARCRRHP